MAESRILVAGYALIDLIPRPHEPGTFNAALGGSPFNTALALGRLGVPTSFAGVISTDAQGERLVAALAAAAVDLTEIRRCAEPTPLAMVTEGTAVTAPLYSFYLQGTAFDRDFRLPEDWAREALHLHVGSTSALVGESAEAALAALDAAAGNASTSFDPNIRPLLLPRRETVIARVEDYVRRATFVKASEEDVAWLYPGRDPADVAAEWASWGPRLVVLTQGAAGATAFCGDLRLGLAAPHVEVANSVGAGDTFMAALLAGLYDFGALGPAAARPNPTQILHCLSLATAAAALTCTRPGADPPSRAEVEAALSRGFASRPGRS